MRKLIVDTDIGADCDDMVALAYLLGKMRDGECELAGVSLCTRRDFAPNCVFSLLKEQGLAEIPIGQYEGNPLPCDSFDHYAKALSSGNPMKVGGATALMRRLLSSNETMDLICVGPMCNLASLLKSKADEFSSLDGARLVEEKVGTLYLMGGAFDFGSGANFAEWNVEQDILSAQYVFESFPRPIRICPSEAGAKVSTLKSSLKGVTLRSMKEFFKDIGNPSLTSRPSWDPLTAMVALNEDAYLFSGLGEVEVHSSGMTKFNKKENGNVSYLLAKNDFAKIENELNACLKAYPCKGANL